MKTKNLSLNAGITLNTLNRDKALMIKQCNVIIYLIKHELASYKFNTFMMISTVDSGMFEVKGEV